MDKRGDVESAKVLVGLLIVVVVAFFILGFVYGLWGIFGKGEERAATSNFNVLVSTVQNLLSNNDTVSATHIPFFVPSDFVLVGFREFYELVPTIDQSPLNTCDNKRAFRPSACGLGACLCLYSDDDFGDISKKDKNVVACAPFEKDIVFLEESDGQGKSPFAGSYYDKHPLKDIYGKPDYELLFLYGECGGKWQAAGVYVEKYADENGKIYVYLARESEDTKKRQAELKNFLEKRKQGVTIVQPVMDFKILVNGKELIETKRGSFDQYNISIAAGTPTDVDLQVVTNLPERGWVEVVAEPFDSELASWKFNDLSDNKIKDKMEKQTGVLEPNKETYTFSFRPYVDGTSYLTVFWREDGSQGNIVSPKRVVVTVR